MQTTHEELLEYFQMLPEIDPDQHDGSYRLVREIVRALGTIPSDLLDTVDLELLYFATVGTFSPSGRFARKKKQILASHLSPIEKERIMGVLEQLEKTARIYGNSRKDGNGSIGMFGTGFATFNRNGGVAKKDVQRIIALCVSVFTEPDEDRCLELAADVLKVHMFGIGIATVSQILHCLKPTIFPVFNSGGESGIEVYKKGLGVNISRANATTSYISNVKKVRDFRNKNFCFKNYRVLDCGWWDVSEMKPLQLKLRPALHYKIATRAKVEGKKIEQMITEILEFTVH